MAKQQGRRIDSQDLSVGTANKQGEVHAHTNVIAKRSNIDFEALGSLVNNYVAKRQDARNEELFQRGIRDERSGEVDEELMQDTAYASAVNKTKGEAIGIRTLASIEPKLQQHLQDLDAEGRLREFDIESWIAEELQGVQGDSLNQDFLKGLNSQTDNIYQVASSIAGAYIAKAEDDEILFTAKAKVREGAMAITDPKKKIAWFNKSNEDLKDLAINRDEYTQIVVESGLEAADLGDVETVKAVKEWLGSRKEAVRGEYASQIDKALQIAEARVARDAEQKKVLDKETELDIHRGFERTIGTDQFSYKAITNAVKEGYLTPEQGISYERKHLDELRKGELNDSIEADFLKLDAQPDLVPYLDDSKLQKDWYERQDKRYRPYAQGFLSLQRQMGQPGADLDSLQAQANTLIDKMSPMIETSKIAGHTPKFMTQIASSAVVGTPQFRAVSRLFETLESQEGFTPFDDIDTESYADIQAFNHMTTVFGMSDEEAEQTIQEAKAQPDRTVVPTLFTQEGSREFDSQIEDLLGEQTQVQRGFFSNDTETDIEVSSSMREAIKEMAIINHRRGIGAEDSITMATNRFLKTHTPVAGAWISNRHMSPAFPEAFEKAISEIEGLSNDEVIIIPQRDLEGHFTIMRKSDGQLLKSKKTGKILKPTYNDFIKHQGAREVEMDEEIVALNKSRSIERGQLQERAKKIAEDYRMKEEEYRKFNYGRNY